jgi:hypothetical protein
MGWMLGLSIALFWLPGIGGLIAGFVGGRKAGGLWPAVVAVFLPGVVLMLVTVLVGALIGWIPLIGQVWAMVAGMGAWALSFMNVIPLLLGAVVGGATAER